MYPDQDSPGSMPTPPQNNFDFIVNPAKKQRKSLLPSFGGGGLLPKIILLVGGAVAIMVVLWVVTVIFGGGGSDVGRITGLVQSQQEIVRVAGSVEDNLFGQNLRNATSNSKNTIISQQSQWNTVLTEQGVELKKDQLALKESAETDEALAAALTSGTLDEAYAEVLENMLRSYATEIENFYNQSKNNAEKERLSANYRAVGLLLQQLTGEAAPSN